MGTKNNPGEFDCYAAAEPDEPLFTFLARDPLAPFMVGIWASVRMGDANGAQIKFDTMIKQFGHRYLLKPDTPKAVEALCCSMAMFAWKEEKNTGKLKPGELEISAPGERPRPSGIFSDSLPDDLI